MAGFVVTSLEVAILFGRIPLMTVNSVFNTRATIPAMVPQRSRLSKEAVQLQSTRKRCVRSYYEVISQSKVSTPSGKEKTDSSLDFVSRSCSVRTYSIAYPVRTSWSSLQVTRCVYGSASPLSPTLITFAGRNVKIPMLKPFP